MSNSTNTLLRKTGRFLLPLALIGCAVAIALWLVKTKPEAKQKAQKKLSTIVEVQQVVDGPEHIYIEAMGVVGPSKRITITTQVTGKIRHIDPNFQPGGFFKKDAIMARIDPRDYQFILQQRQAALRSSRSELVQETGNQLVALKEFELLGEPVSAEEKHLMLRGPQLKKLQNNLNADQARYEQAQLNLARTKIKAPFNGTVDSLKSNIGSLVTNGTALASFTGTDEFWLRLLVPVNQLQWITIPKEIGEKGSQVQIFNDAVWPAGSHRLGEVIRLNANLEEDGRRASLIVRIVDPLALRAENADKPALLLNSYVRGKIDCRTIPRVVKIKRQYMRDGDNIWIMSPKKTLEIRPLQVLFKNQNEVIIKQGLERGEKYITSPLTAPISGMLLQAKDEILNRAKSAMEKE